MIPHPVSVNGCRVTSCPTTQRLKPRGRVTSRSGAEAEALGSAGSFSHPSWCQGWARGRAALTYLTWPGVPHGAGAPRLWNFMWWLPPAPRPERAPPRQRWRLDVRSYPGSLLLRSLGQNSPMKGEDSGLQLRGAASRGPRSISRNARRAASHAGLAVRVYKAPPSLDRKSKPAQYSPRASTVQSCSRCQGTLRHAELGTRLPSLNPSPGGQVSLTPVTDRETEAQRGEMTCSTSPSQDPNPGAATALDASQSTHAKPLPSTNGCWVPRSAGCQ